MNCVNICLLCVKKSIPFHLRRSTYPLTIDTSPSSCAGFGCLISCSTPEFSLSTYCNGENETIHLDLKKIIAFSIHNQWILLFRRLWCELPTLFIISFSFYQPFYFFLVKNVWQINYCPLSFYDWINKFEGMWMCLLWYQNERIMGKFVCAFFVCVWPFSWPYQLHWPIGKHTNSSWICGYSPQTTRNLSTKF